jgi:hypothetical protein
MYFVIQDIQMAFDDFEGCKEQQNWKDWKDLATVLVSAIGDAYGYIYGFHSTYNETDIALTPITHLTFHCSQRLNNWKDRKVKDVQKQRQCKGEDKFPCQGQIRITYNNTQGNRLAHVKLRAYKRVPIGKWGVIVHFHHECYHQPRQQLPFPPEIRHFIQKHFKTSAFDMYQEMLAARDRGELKHNLKTVTDHNLRYW